MERSETPDEDIIHHIPALPKALQHAYEGLLAVGAVGPSSGHDLKRLAKELHEGKKQLEHELHMLEGKGVVAHQTSGNETVWYARK